MLAAACATCVRGQPQLGHEGAETEQACRQSGQFLNLCLVVRRSGVDAALALGVDPSSHRAQIVTSFGEGAPQEGQNDSFIMWFLNGCLSTQARRLISLSSSERQRAVGRKRTSAAPQFLLTLRFDESRIEFGSVDTALRQMVCEPSRSD